MYSDYLFMYQNGLNLIQIEFINEYFLDFLINI